MKKPAQQPEPHVGIFWLVGTRLISDTTALSAAGKCGDFKIHDGDHVTHWAAMEKRGEVPRDTDYEELPRGRVVFDGREQRSVCRCVHSTKEERGEEIAAASPPARRHGIVNGRALSLLPLSHKKAKQFD